jgi:hypothetical protein
MVTGLIVIVGCAGLHGGANLAGTEMVRTELFCGLTRPGGADITDAEFKSFLDEIVSVRYPIGYTVLSAEGRWREQTGITRVEPTRVILILHEPTPEENLKIEQIRSMYKTRFSQEAVLRVDDIERVRFE